MKLLFCACATKKTAKNSLSDMLC